MSFHIIPYQEKKSPYIMRWLFWRWIKGKRVKYFPRRLSWRWWKLKWWNIFYSKKYWKTVKEQNHKAIIDEIMTWPEL